MKNPALVCCDPFKTHKKIISSGVLILRKNVYEICQRHNVPIAENVGVCINCLKKLQMQSNENGAERVSVPCTSMNKVNMKNKTLMCCNPFKTHKKEITSGVVNLPRNVYDKCQRLDIDIVENAQICINCIKKLEGQNHEKKLEGQNQEKKLEGQNHEKKLDGQNHEEKLEDQNHEKKLEGQNDEKKLEGQNHEKNAKSVLEEPDTSLDIGEVDVKNITLLPVVCCDPFKSHKKKITVGVVNLPKNMYNKCQRHDIDIVENAKICINCINKLQTHINKNGTESVPRPSAIIHKMKNTNISGSVCCNPFKTHRKQITSGVFNLPKNVFFACQTRGVNIAENARVCINCLKKLQDDNCEIHTQPEVTSYPQIVASPEDDFSFSQEILGEVLPNLDINQVKIEGLSPTVQVSKVLAKFKNVDTSLKRNLCKTSNGTRVDEDQHRKKRTKRLHMMGETAATDNMSTRGALIVLEGCDRTGKTTQAHKLVETMVAAGKSATFMRFPDRSTKIGSIIDSYLGCGSELEDHAIHLLFSANRWESLPKIMSTLESGTSIIIDRYAFSGVAFSAAKEGMSLEWCKQSDVGLPKPDLVLFLDLHAEEAQRRSQFGEERYEKADFQERVYANYKLLHDDTWKVIDANRTIDDLQDVLKSEVLKTIDSIKGRKIGKLWV